VPRFSSLDARRMGDAGDRVRIKLDDGVFVARKGAHFEREDRGGRNLSR